MQTITRRAALATPLAFAATIPAVAEAQPQETPVLRLFREWQALDDVLDALPRETSEEVLEGMIDDLYALEDRLLATPSQGALDIVAKASVAARFGLSTGTAHDHLMWAEARELLERA
ncbi:hypothetical protein D1122_20630 [Cereibacter sphaeroides]|uniref:hypothetical protein n=1 Tax=Cereibacter sphaeroides TaxID=1063 RepID=UPI000E5C1D77|nr:hypothetical protein [Cereibacter sphaeroides]RHZ91861.1 hypothetical protein D1122_20630 [Cereibacter sphaeroides]